jgi:hypothetical protein
VLVHVVLQPLVRRVDAQLVKSIMTKILKPKNVQKSDALKRQGFVVVSAKASSQVKSSQGWRACKGWLIDPRKQPQLPKFDCLNKQAVVHGVSVESDEGSCLVKLRGVLLGYDIQLC